jgi:hypothetical protein
MAANGDRRGGSPEPYAHPRKDQAPGKGQGDPAVRRAARQPKGQQGRDGALPGFAYMLKIVAESTESYHHFFINHLGGVRGIGQTKSTFVMDIIKDTHRIL